MTDRDSVQTLWVNQPGESFTMSIDEIRARASKFQSVVQRRNFIEYAVGAVLIVVFSAIALVAATPLAKLGCALIAVGVAVVMWRLYALARAATDDEMAVVNSWASFYRQELVRQRDALQQIWRWYLGPLIPGLIVFWLSVSEISLWGWATAMLGLAATAFVFAAVASANKRAVETLQAEIEGLDAACKT